MDRKTFIQKGSHILLGILFNSSTLPVMNIPYSSFKRESNNDTTITLFLSGDVMTGRGIDQICAHSVDPQLFEPYVKDARYYVELAEHKSGPIPRNISPEYIWGDALAMLNKIKPDARIINLETAVTISDNHWTDKSIHYRMHPQNTLLLTQANIDVCVLANNHVLDWGRPGLSETLNVLRSNAIKTAGAGEDAKTASSPATVTTPSARILIFGFATEGAGIRSSWKATQNQSGINLLESLNPRVTKNVIHHINTFKQEGDIVVVSIHWGGNWGYSIPKAQRRFAHALADSSAVDIIHGHSSHHPKGIEVHNGHLILYGCGDLINDYEGISGYEEYRDDLSLLYLPTLDLAGSLVALQMIPMKISKFRLIKASENDSQWLYERLNKECESLNTSLELAQDGSLLLQW